jgi:hypothetical protein
MTHDSTRLDSLSSLHQHSQTGVLSLVMTMSIRDIVVGTRLLVAFGFPMM